MQIINIFNVFLIIGITALMIAAVTFKKNQLDRGDALTLLLIYVAYMVWLSMMQ